MSRSKTPQAKPRTTSRTTPRAKAAVTAAPDDVQLVISFKTAAIIYLVISTGYFLPAFLPDRGIFGTDYLAGGYQFMEFIAQQLRSGVLPKWVPFVYGGVPLHANPGGTYYPSRLLLTFVLPDSRILPALLLLQFAVAGTGMYLFARELGARTWVAFVAGLAFMFTGIIHSGVYSGHDGRIIVATFAPMVFFFLHRGMRTGATSAFVGVGATLGFSMLSFQIQSTYYLLLGAASWTIFCAFRFREATWPVVAARMAKALAGVALAFVLAAVNFLPFIDYVAESPRGAQGGRGYEYATSFSMPPGEISGLAIPEQQGFLGTYHGKSFFKQHTEYVGALVIALLLLGPVFARRNKYWWFFVGVALVALSISLGGYTPIYKLYFNFLPGTDKFRAPSISFFMVSFSLVTMAFLTLERLASLRDGMADEERAAKKQGRTRTAADLSRHAAAGLMGVALLFVVTSPALPRGSAPVGWIRFGLFLGIIGVLLWRWLSGRLESRTLALALSVVTLSDLWIIDRRFFQTVKPPEEIYAADDVVNFLSSQKDSGRVWVFPFGNQAVYHGADRIGRNTIPLRNYLMHFGFEQAGGEHGNQLERWNVFAGKGEQVYVDWHNFTTRPAFLNAANIRYIVSGLELRMVETDSGGLAGIEEVYRGPTQLIYRTQALPRAYLVPSVRVMANTDSALSFMRARGWNPGAVAVVDRPLSVELPLTPLVQSSAIVVKEPNRVVIRTNTNRPALLVLADVYAHGWKAWVDDKPVPIAITNIAFRGVPVGAGEHVVRFQFEPRELRTGLVISGILFGLLIVYALTLLVLHYRGRKPQEVAA